MKQKISEVGIKIGINISRSVSRWVFYAVKCFALLHFLNYKLYCWIWVESRKWIFIWEWLWERRFLYFDLKNFQRTLCVFHWKQKIQPFLGVNIINDHSFVNIWLIIPDLPIVKNVKYFKILNIFYRFISDFQCGLKLLACTVYLITL